MKPGLRGLVIVRSVTHPNLVLHYEWYPLEFSRIELIGISKPEIHCSAPGILIAAYKYDSSWGTGSLEADGGNPWGKPTKTLKTLDSKRVYESQHRDWAIIMLENGTVATGPLTVSCIGSASWAPGSER